MKQSKKGQGLSMNTIVIAAIAILVLVVLSVIFIGKMGWFNNKSNDCASLNGICQEAPCQEGYFRSEGVCRTGTEVDNAQVCCVKIS